MLRTLFHCLYSFVVTPDLGHDIMWEMNECSKVIKKRRGKSALMSNVPESTNMCGWCDRNETMNYVLTRMLWVIKGVGSGTI